MDVSKVLAALRREKEQIDEVIVNLERLEQGRDRRRGRPPVSLTGVRKRGRPRGSKNKASLRTNGLAAIAKELPPRVMAAGQSSGAEDPTLSPDVM